MTKELEALLTELYVLIDDQVVEPRHGRGRRPELSDSELLCLAVAQMLLGLHSERRWVGHAQRNPDLRRMFPYMPQQPGYHKRLKASRGLLCNMIRVLAGVCPSWSEDMWITDATPVPCGTSRETVTRSDLAGHAGYAVLRELLALLLGSEALPGLRRRRHADHVVPGPPQDR
jgi:hypothetical protein